MNRLSVVVSLPLALGLAVPALGSAQQPLEEFLAASDTYSTDVREAEALARSADAAAGESRGRLLPSATGTLSYTRNEYDVRRSLGAGMPELVIAPYDQFDARGVITVPLLDIGAWMSFIAAEENADAVAERSEAQRDTVHMTVVQTWHQLVAARAMIRAAEESVRVNEEARDSAAARVEVGVSPAGELARAEAEAARARQTLAEARLNAVVAAQNLEVVTGITANEREVTLSDDLHAEAPLDSFVAGVDELPAVRAARYDVAYFERLRDAAWGALMPTISASFTERATNAAGFNPSTVWALAFTATWTLDFGRPYAVVGRDESATAATIRAEEAGLLARAQVVEAWHRVASTIERVSAARAALDASVRAAEDAAARYEAGAGTQLESIISERDRFTAEVTYIQALGDLRVARAALRIRSGIDPL